MALAAAELHGHPSSALRVVGITGTNGKTTTAFLVQAILDAAGQPTGVMGTMTGSRTTPESPVVQAQLAAFRDEGKRAAAMEVSSVGLVQRRVEAVEFAAAVFTNLSAEHLDDHGTMEAYFEAKSSLFVPGRAKVGVVNADDGYGLRLLESAPIPMRPFSMADAAGLELAVGRSRFEWHGVPVVLPLDGAFNVANALAAATVADELGIGPDEIAAALTAFEGVPGHAESVDAGQDFRLVIDYAHTPAALAAVLDAARLAAGDDHRVIAVFGCGGDRDPSKRSPMGHVASSAADIVIVTSDNPRTEDPEAIIGQIVEGATGGALVRAEVDRRRAISLALGQASPGDVVVIAGKGHESGQTIGDTVLPFDDRTVALELLDRPGSA
jgi:UDP-N-acetylmuramoyl-L-alanyl-D-glutamate--2,6-diaminopimelate ligase